MSTTVLLPNGPALAWRNDVALEIWVDGCGPSIAIRLSGTLDDATATNLPSLVGELIDEGGRQISLDTHGLRVTDGGGRAALAEVRRLIQAARRLPLQVGIHWSGSLTAGDG